MTKKRIKDNVCPYCLSRLFDDQGVMVCTGSKLKMWEGDFKRYEKMNSNEKKKYLISFSDSEKFIDLYEKWSLSDADGNRPNFTCGYTNQIFSPVPDNRIIMPDPLQVKRIERNLNRTLTPDEIEGNKDIIVQGKVVKLERMVFPDDF